MIDELGDKVMLEFAALRPKTRSYLIDDGDENKKSKRYKEVCHKAKTYISRLSKLFKRNLT